MHLIVECCPTCFSSASRLSNVFTSSGRVNTYTCPSAVGVAFIDMIMMKVFVDIEDNHSQPFNSEAVIIAEVRLVLKEKSHTYT